MELIDIGVLAVILIPALVGVIYGFLNIVFSIAVWGVAFGLAVKFNDSFSPLLESWVETELIRNMLAFVGLFALCLIIFSALGYFMLKLLGRTGLTGADRILGFLFGLVLGCAIISVLVFLAGFTDLTRTDWWQSSLTMRPFERIGDWGARFLPENVASYHGYDPQNPINSEGG